MNRGRIEQVGDPNSIYRSPVSSFVADFVGAANIVDAASLGAGAFETPFGRLTVAGDGTTAGERVKLSWRPEDMKIVPAGTGNIAGTQVRNLVFRGNLTDLMVTASDQLLRAQVASDVSLREGETVDFALSPDRIRVVT
jgi:putative spermidine/putrescine transport system ATP-binding protein